MKLIQIIFLTVLSFAIFSAAFESLVKPVHALGTCGITPPEPPLSIGCAEQEPVCLCQDDGDCDWSWMCITDDKDDND